MMGRHQGPFPYIAVMALQIILSVINQRQAALRAFYDKAAGTAHNKCRITASIEHDDYLLMFMQGFIDKRYKRSG